MYMIFEKIKNFLRKHPRLSRVLAIGAAVIVSTAFNMIPLGAIGATTLLSRIKKDYSRDEFNDATMDVIRSIGSEFSKEVILDAFSNFISDQENLKQLREVLGADEIMMAVRQYGVELSLISANVQKYISLQEYVLRELEELKEISLYYYLPANFSEIKDFWRIPEYIDRVVERDERILNYINRAYKIVSSGKNVIFVGPPGVGKTVLLYLTCLDFIVNRKVNVAIAANSVVRNYHEKKGIFLFIDDVIRDRVALESIYRNNPRMIIATARTEDWRISSSKYKELFEPIHIDPPPETVIRDIILKYARHFGISVEEEAISRLIIKSDRNPAYIRYFFEDLSRQGIKIVDTEMANRVPDGMKEYVAEILREIFYKDNEIKKGAYGVAIALRTLGDLRENCVNERVFIKMYELSTKLAIERFNDVEDWGLFMYLRGFLVTKKDLRAVSYPHDTWYDVIVSKDVENPVVGLFTAIENKVPPGYRIELIRKSFAHALEHVKSECKINPHICRVELMSIKYYERLNEDILRRSIKVEIDENEHLTTNTAWLLKSLPKELEKPQEIPHIIVRVRGKEYVLSASQFEIGRNPQGYNLEIRTPEKTINTEIFDRFVSRKHLLVELRSQKIYVTDLGSRNGTYLNNIRIEPFKRYELKAGKIKIGNTEIEIII